MMICQKPASTVANVSDRSCLAMIALSNENVVPATGTISVSSPVEHRGALGEGREARVDELRLVATDTA